MLKLQRPPPFAAGRRNATRKQRTCQVFGLKNMFRMFEAKNVFQALETISLSLYIYIYIYIDMYMHMYIFTYICICVFRKSHTYSYMQIFQKYLFPWFMLI